MAVVVRRSTMVRPARDTPRHRLWLSNLDLVMPHIHTPNVYFFRRPEGVSPEAFFDGARMRDALAEALVTFYPMAGRLARDEGGRIEICCNGEGVLFVEADAPDTTVEDYGDFAPTRELMRLIPAIQDTEDITAVPLLVVQVTYFKCGGVSLGVGMQHYAVDGMSAAHLMNSWSELCRGTQISVMPVIDRTLLSCRDPPSPAFQHVEYQPSPEMLSSPAAKDITSKSPDAAGIFKFTSSDLSRLRSQLPTGEGTRRFSTYAMLTAHVWRCASLARGLPPGQPTKWYCATDGRRRLQPPLPDGYFGNVVFTAAAIAEVRKVTSGLAVGAAIVQEALDRMDNEYCRSALDYLGLQPDLSAVSMSRGPNLYQNPNIGLTSWVRLPIHDADFGWGRPVFMGTCTCEGLGFVLPSADGDGSLSIAICLEVEHMEKFRKLIFEL